MGRRSVYVEEVADEVCRLIAGGLSLAEVCRRDGMPPRQTVQEWVLDDREGFAGKYARARDQQLEHWADELLLISDDGKNDWMQRNAADNPGWQLNGEHVQRSKLRSDSRKWLLSKLKPQQYGDRLEHVGAGGKDLIPEHAGELDRIVGALAAVLKTTPDGG